MTQGIEFKFKENLYKALLPRNPFEIKRRLADRLFSKLVRARDKYSCVRCGHEHNPKSKGLHVSHYFSRKRESTRFHFDNVDSLCTACHFNWSHNEGRVPYEQFKKAQMGPDRYEELVRLAKIPNTEFMAHKGGRRLHDQDKIREFRAALTKLKESAIIPS